MGEDDPDDVHPLRERIDRLAFDGDTETARKLRLEAEQTLERQLNALDDVDTKAMRILRVNVVLVGLLLTAASLATDSNHVAIREFHNPYTVIGLGSLLASTALAAFTYTASDTEVGIDPRTIQESIEADLTEREFEIGAAQSYAHWIDFNDSTNVRNAPFITSTILLAVAALSHLSIGIYVALVDEYTVVFVAVAWVGLLALGFSSGLPAQLGTARNEWSLPDWFR